jgi:hypothetical protein
LEPKLGECISPFASVVNQGLKDYQLCFLMDIDDRATWDDIIAGRGRSLATYILPLRNIEQKKIGRILKHETIQGRAVR